MTGEERRILFPLASSLRSEFPGMWADLKYETQYGPESCEFPYYPAAIEFQDSAQQAIAGLSDSDKMALVEAWRSKPRYPCDFTHPDRILQQYGVILVDLIVTRARQAGARTNEF